MKNRVIGLLLAASVAGMLSGCEEKAITDSRRITMEVVGVTLKSKSNSKVDLKVVGAPTTYYNERLRCRKSMASNVKIGSKWDVTVQDYKWGDNYGSELVGVDAICDLSN
ncbi:hypothetical protein D3C75_224050 [compost metagenome]